MMFKCLSVHLVVVSVFLIRSCSCSPCVSIPSRPITPWTPPRVLLKLQLAKGSERKNTKFGTRGEMNTGL